MATGRKPIPTFLKAVRGNPGKRPLNEKEPQSRRKRLLCPPHISGRGRGIWEEVVDLIDEMGILTAADAVSVEVLVLALVEFREAVDALEKYGRYYQTHSSDRSESIIWRAHPAIAAQADADRRIRAWCSEFGMTPSSRSRIEINQGKNADPAEEYFKVA